MKELSLSIGDPSASPLVITTPKEIGIFNLNELLNLGITILMVAGVLLSLFFLITSGLEWIMSGGEKEKIQKARGRITYAIIGLIVIFLSYFIINLIGAFFGVPLLGGSQPDSRWCRNC